MIDPSISARPIQGRPRRDSLDLEQGRREGYVELIETILGLQRPEIHRRWMPAMTKAQRIAWMQEHCPGAMEWLQEIEARRLPQRASPRGVSRPDMFRSS